MPTQRLPRQASLEPLRTQKYRILPVPDVSSGPCPPTECTPTVVWTDTFGMDDFLQIIYQVPFPDTFALTEEGLGAFIGLFDTLGVDDRLTLVQAITYYTDTFGIDDQLSLVSLVGLFTDSLGLDDALVAKVTAYFSDTFGMDDSLTLVGIQSGFLDTFGVDDGPLGVAVSLFETLGMDDRLTFVTLLITYADTFGMDDQLTLATVATVYADTVGIDDSLALVDLFTDQPDSLSVTDILEAIDIALVDTVGSTDDLSADIQANYVEGGLLYLTSTGLTFDGRAETADDAVLDITGDIRMRFAIRPDDATPSAVRAIAYKWATGQASYGMYLDTTGSLGFQWTTGGVTTITRLSTAAIGISDGELILVEAFLDVDNGASGHTVTFRKKSTTERTIRADLQDDSGWTDIGTPVVTAGTTSIFSGTAALRIGNVLGIVVWTGRIYGGLIRNSSGTTVWDWLAADATSVFSDVTEIANSLTVSFVNPSTSNAIDNVRYGPVAPGAHDLLSAITAEFLYKSRSGTPNNDVIGDGWIDQAATGTNHGNETPLIAKGKSTLANDERRAFVKFLFKDIFSGIVGLGANSVVWTFTVTNTDLLSAADLSVAIRRHSANPFTESTLTWNTPVAGGPVAGTLIKTQTFNIAANTTTTINPTLTLAELDTFMASADTHIYLRFTGPTALAPVVFNIASRENATASNKPRMAVYAQR